MFLINSSSVCMGDVMKPLLILVGILLSACATMPPVLKNVPAVDVNLNQVRGNIDGYRGTPVRWGGTIIEVENEENLTRIQILYYPLNKSGRPRLDKEPEGRFIIQSPKFLDPAVYRDDIEMTVTGTISGAMERTIGNKVLALPVVETGTIYLWPEDRYRNVYYGPYRGYHLYYPYRYSRFGYYYYPGYYWY